MTKTLEKKMEVTEEETTLKKWIKPGVTVWTLLRHRAPSGMSRVLDVYVMVDNEPLRLTWSVAKVLDWTYDRKHEGVKVNGCGLDVGYHLVYSLSRVLFKDGLGCIGEGCKSNDHNNPGPDRDNYAVGRKHSDPGYGLNHRWL